MDGLGRALEMVVDQLHDGVYIVDLEGHITFWSAGAERLIGYRANEVLGRSCSDGFLLHLDALGQPACGANCPLARAIRTGTMQSGLYWALHSAGHRIPVQVRVVPIADTEGRITGAIEAFTNNTAMAAAEERLQELERSALLDHLTQMPNRRHLESRIFSTLAESERYGTRFGVLLMDLDHFKTVNDTHGHQAGDEALRMVSRTLGAAVRACDRVGRWGGEEFMLVATGVRRDGLLRAGERFRALIERCRGHYGDVPIQVTISIGAALALPGDTVDSLVFRADRALYRAKELGRNRVVMDGDATASAAIAAGAIIPLEAVPASAAEVAAPARV